MPTQLAQPSSDPADLDIGTLAFIAGSGFNEAVAARLHAAGYPDVRPSFGYVVQHLIAGPRSATELAALLGISQQAATKRLQEMLAAGLLDEVPGPDARRRNVALSERGRQMLATARALRADVAAAMLEGMPPADVAAARRVLQGAIERLGLVPAVQDRRLREAP